ncbi:MAG: hypothetical protein WCI36_04770 [bacterium]
MLESHKVFSEREMVGPVMAISSENELISRRFRDRPAVESRKASIFLKVDPTHFVEFISDPGKHQQLGEDISEMLQKVFAEDPEKDTGEKRYILSFVATIIKMLHTTRELELSIFLAKLNSSDLNNLKNLIICHADEDDCSAEYLRITIQDILKDQKYSF